VFFPFILPLPNKAPYFCTMEYQLRVKGMSCTACAAAVEAALKKCPGIQQAQVSFALEEAHIQIANAEAIPLAIAAVQKAGYQAALMTNPEQQTENPRLALWALAFTLPVFISGMFFHTHVLTPFIGLIFSTPVLWLGRGFFIRGIQQVRQRLPGMDTLVALSTGISYLYSVVSLALGQTHVLFFEAASMVLSFVMLGKWLESRAKHKTASGLKSLLEIMPHSARLHLTGERVPLGDLNLNTLIEVSLGEEVPVDGLLESGQLELNSSWLTGESLPVLVLPGNPVFAGSVVLNGNGIVRVSAIADASRLGQTLAQVKRAMVSNPPIKRLADALAAKFVWFVLVFAALSAATWFYIAPHSPGLFALQVGLTVLAVACPCALGLAVPTAIYVALGKAAQKSIFFQKPEALESLANVNRVFLDKTGTLTLGKPRVAWASNQNESIKIRVGHLASRSQHPLSKSLVEWSGFQANADYKMEQSLVSEIPGLGLETTGDSGILRLGAPNWAGPWPSDVVMDGSPVVLGDGVNAFAAFLLQDEARPDLERVLKELDALGVPPVVLTGDHSLSPQLKLILDPYFVVRLNQSPEDKIQTIIQSKAEGNTVLMAGDGMNDAPALAEAHVAIAMGDGSHLAKHCSHISLGNSNLLLLPETIRIARQAKKIMRQNMFWALSYNALVLPLAAGVLYPLTGHLFNPMWAGMAMAFSSILVLLNSLRLSLS
jgi:Cu2+-exporting ATPase